LKYIDILEQGMTEPLVAYERGGFIEGLHRGAIAVTTSDGRNLASVGNPQLGAIIRSCAKPFQLLSVLASGAVEQFSLADSELAVAASSHSGEPEHLAEVAAMIKKIGIDSEMLNCGLHEPMFPFIARRLQGEGRVHNVLDNNCSGKHSAMLAACKSQGWQLDNYEAIAHPLQQQNLARTAAFAGLDIENVGIAIDGCTVPTFHLPLAASAIAFARIADPELAPAAEAERAARVFEIMNSYPANGSGKEGRLEAKLMQMFPGKLIAKVGAEGFFAIGLAPGVLDKRGVGITMKLEDGITFNRAADGVVVEALRQLGLLSAEQVEELRAFHPQAVLNNRGGKIGDVRYLFNLL
jgi:L-asparaginase II